MMMNMIKLIIHSGVLHIYQSHKYKILDQKDTKYKKGVVKRNQKSICCRAGDLPHEKITSLYPHSTGVGISA